MYRQKCNLRFCTDKGTILHFVPTKVQFDIFRCCVILCGAKGVIELEVFNATAMTLSNRLRHFFHVVSNVRPIVWIGLYVCITPLFALVYWALPDAEFRMPDGAPTGYLSWLYYSVVTITTLGFGDFTPAHLWAQGVTAIEVMCGLIFLGFFLNSVGAMKSEIDITSEAEKNRMLHEHESKEKLVKSTPGVMHLLNVFMAYCYCVTTPVSKRSDTSDTEFNPQFDFKDMADMFKPSGLPFDHSNAPAVVGLIKSAARASLCLDSLQTRTDMTLWPELLEDCFAFVANYQVFSTADDLAAIAEGKDEQSAEYMDKLSKLIASAATTADRRNNPELAPAAELYAFIKENGELARRIETQLTEIASASSDNA